VDDFQDRLFDVSLWGWRRTSRRSQRSNRHFDSEQLVLIGLDRFLVLGDRRHQLVSQLAKSFHLFRYPRHGYSFGINGDLVRSTGFEPACCEAAILKIAVSTVFHHERSAESKRDSQTAQGTAIDDLVIAIPQAKNEFSACYLL
jgi:hypothetical protein